jgi:hypothetical protein
VSGASSARLNALSVGTRLTLLDANTMGSGSSIELTLVLALVMALVLVLVLVLSSGAGLCQSKHIAI